MDLFEHALRERLRREAPLAARMRPRTLEEFIGQEEIIGEGRLLRRAIETDRLFSSILLWGPPGSGKTTLASIIAHRTQAHFESISAVLAGIAELRRVIADARERRSLHGTRTTLFVDEVHRWNKAQQDALLPHIEDGTLTFVGATTENPYFEVIGALVSRSRVFQLRPLSDEDVRRILAAALADGERGYGSRTVRLDDEALDHLVRVAGGDARNALNALELAVESTPASPDGALMITLAVAQESIQRRAVLYDKDGDSHYDTISAFIKSVRGSDPDAALYYLCRMLDAGEDPLYLARRVVRMAVEDIGLADPQALAICNAAKDAYDFLGSPEGELAIAQAVIYLATAPKSNAAYKAYGAAMRTAKEAGSLLPPKHILNAPTKLMQSEGYGSGYDYDHDAPDAFSGQDYFPEQLGRQTFYDPPERGFEREIRKRLDYWAKLRKERSPQ
jgi:putative ATPase